MLTWTVRVATSGSKGYRDFTFASQAEALDYIKKRGKTTFIQRLPGTRIYSVEFKA